MYPPYNYNGYLSKSQRRIKRKQEQETNESRQTQYSDTGRYLLGNPGDAESVEFRKRSVGSVSQETVNRWKDFQTELREQCSLRKVTAQETEKIDEKLKTFPKKKSEVIEDIDDYPPQYDRSKYKFVRKVEENDDDCQIIKVTPRSSSEEKEVLLKNAQPPPKIIEKASEKRSSDKTDDPICVVIEEENDKITPMEIHVVAEIATSSSPQKENSPPEIIAVTSVTPPLSPPSPKTMTPECILHKYGHCFSARTCPFAHNGRGVLQKVGRRQTMATGWKRKLPNVPICLGYFNFQCWNFDCEMRHIVYPSDDI